MQLYYFSTLMFESNVNSDSIQTLNLLPPKTSLFESNVNSDSIQTNFW